jgi:toxin ParE1/3/4
MPARARLSRLAQREFNEAARWIASDSPSAARALRDAVQRAAHLIAEHPLIGVSRPDLAPAPFRFLVVRGFPYLAIYDPTTPPPTIVRIVHGARDLPEVLRDL